MDSWLRTTEISASDSLLRSFRTRYVLPCRLLLQISARF